MRFSRPFWRRVPAPFIRWIGYGAVAASAALLALNGPEAYGQGRGRGEGGGRTRVQGGGNATVRLPSVSGQAGGGATVRVPQGDAQIRVPAGGTVRLPEIRGPGATVRLPQAGGEVRVPGASGQVRVPGAAADVRVPGAGANVDVPRTALRPNLDANIRGGTRLDGSASARVPDGVRIDPSVSSQANLRFSPNWANLTRDRRVELDQFRTSLNNTLRAQVRSDARVPGARLDADARVGANQWLALNPDRARVWSDWGTQARTGFQFGPSPFFNYNWWNSRSLIGIGLGGYGWGIGPGYGGWWGYQPWLGYRPWWYWYSRPLWGSLLGWFPGWGWNTPYYYDYGPGGNVVYTGNQVMVYGQPVGTTTAYAQSAAELASVDPASVGQTRPEDWLPLGTFTLSTAKDEADPARVIQLAVNKDGLISGTSFNKQTGKTYTVQGRVDKDTQRLAFTIGNATDIVLETGLFNLTQDQTPVLAHLGANRTATYLLARLPEPQHEAEVASPAAADVPPALP